MKHGLMMLIAAATATITIATTAIATAHAEPALPAAMRAKLEALAPLQPPTIYVPAAGGIPDRWLAFVSPTPGAAMAAFVVTPGAGKDELKRIDGWPIAARVIGGVLVPLPATMPGPTGSPQLWVLVESLDAPLLGQPAGLRGVVQIPLDGPVSSTFTAAVYAENLPSFVGVKDVSEIAARLATADAYWQEDTTDVLLSSDARRQQLVKTAAKSKAALAKLFPTAGIAVLESWQGVFARERTRLHALDTSPSTNDLHAALAGISACASRACDGVMLGAEGGHAVIRAIVVAQARAGRRDAARHVVPANAHDTQTMATARLLGVAGAFRVEAPLGTGAGATLGLVDSTIVLRDGVFATAIDSYLDATGGEFGFADLDGDGVTDFVAHGPHTHVVFGGPPHATGDLEAGLELVIADKPTVAAMLDAALAIAPDTVTPKAACALLATTKTAAGVTKALAPGGAIYSFQEPFHPGWGDVAAFSPKDAARELHTEKRCDLTCDDKLPICAHHEEGPGADFYVFTRIDGKLRLFRAAVYRGA